MQLQANLQLDTGTVDNLDDRIHHMSEHMKNVQQELKHNLVRAPQMSYDFSTL